MEQTQPASNNHRNKIIVLGVFFLVAFIGVSGIFAYIRHTKYYIMTDDAYVTGRIHSIASKVPGTIKSLYAKDNQYVKKGDLLLEIDSTDYDVRVKDAQAVLNAERSRLNEFSIRIDVAEKQLAEIRFRIDAAQANLKLQQANLHQALLDLNRAQRLFQKEILPEERLEKAKTGYDVALAQVDAAREQLKQAQAALETQKAAVVQAKATYSSQVFTIAQRQEMLNAEQLKQGYTKIYAPTDGYVTKRAVEVGNQVQAGQPLMAIVPLNDVWVLANYKETQLERVKPGQKARIKVDTYPGTIFRGTVESIMAGTGNVFSLFPPENATGNYVKVVQRIPVKIVLDKGTDPDHLLRVGMSVVPTISIRER